MFLSFEDLIMRNEAPLDSIYPTIDFYLSQENCEDGQFILSMQIFRFLYIKKKKLKLNVINKCYWEKKRI